MDPTEGNINRLHGLPEWAVTATLVRDNQPVLTAVHLPLTGETYTALTGAGAHVDGRPLRVSPTEDLGLSLVATSQASPLEHRPPRPHPPQQQTRTAQLPTLRLNELRSRVVG